MGEMGFRRYLQMFCFETLVKLFDIGLFGRRMFLGRISDSDFSERTTVRLDI